MQKKDKNNREESHRKSSNKGIAKHMTLGKATVEKLEAVEDKYKRVAAVVNLTKTKIAAMMVTNVTTVRVQTS